MKEEECKVPIQEDHRSFLNHRKKKTYTDSKKIAIIGAFLLLICMSLMIVFTLNSINGLNELRQEVEDLKTSLKVLRKEIGYRDDNQESNNDYSDDLYDYANYDDQEYEDSDDGTPSNILLPAVQFTKDAKVATAPPKTKRSITGYTEDGLNSESYMESRRRNGTYKKNYHSQYFSTPPSSYSYPFYPQVRTHSDVEHSTLGPRSMPLRRSRIMQHDSENIGENPDVEFGIVDEDQLGTRTRHRQRRVELDEHVRTGRMRPLPTAHFSGDTSKYVLGQHDNFNGNGHLRHPQRTFVDWTASSWFHTLGMERHFSLSDGLLTIKEPGLYFIYAQIYYYDQHDINGFRVYKNENETLLQCTTMTHSAGAVMKSNTCFTAAAEYLNENDKISLGDVSDSRYSLFEPGKSFFGVIKLGDVRIK